MKTVEAITFYGTQTKLAEALGMGQSTISEWPEYPPSARQLQIERITIGALKAEPGCLDRVLGMDKLTKESTVS